MLKSKFPGKPGLGGRAQASRTRIQTGKIFRSCGQRFESEAGTSGLHEVANIKKGFEDFVDFCGASDEVKKWPVYIDSLLKTYYVVRELLFELWPRL